jgi:RNA polymerase sigma-70 factor (ECF subfamily)
MLPSALASLITFHRKRAKLSQAELARRLTHALAILPLEQRSVAQLKLWDGLTFEEIAEVQGIPLNTAASRYRYALEKLRSELRPLYDELKPA